MPLLQGKPIAGVALVEHQKCRIAGNPPQASVDINDLGRILLRLQRFCLSQKEGDSGI